MNLRFLALVALLAWLACGGQQISLAQTVVYSNQQSLSFVAIGFSPLPVVWDDLQIVGGGTLSEVSFLAQHDNSSVRYASGYIDLRIFDDVNNVPQGSSLGLIPFDDVFAADPTYSSITVIRLTNLESYGITLPDSAKIGAGILFDDSSWYLPTVDFPTIGSSPGGNWLGNSSLERFDSGGNFGWELVVAEDSPYITWNTSFGSWDQPLNWDRGELPQAGQYVKVRSTAQVATVTGPTVDTTVGTVQVGELAYSNTTLQLQPGVTLTATDAFFLSFNGYLDVNGGTIVTGDYSGRPTTFDAGTIHVIDGEFFPTPDDYTLSGTGNPTVLLEGALYHVGFGETWSDLTIGAATGQSGTIVASGGATFTAANITVAKTAGSQGELRLAGAGTTLEVEAKVTLGEELGAVPSVGHGLLVVEDQAVATMAELEVGLMGRGEVIVDNATLNVPENTSNNDSGEIRMGGKAPSTFTIRNGGVVNTAFFDISNANSDTATATVTGGGSQLHASRGIAVGESKEGKFHALDGAEVTTRVLSTGNGAMLAAGRLNEIIIDGQQTQVDIELFLNANTRGSVQVSGGAHVTANSAEALGGSLLVSGSGTLLDVSTSTSQAYSLGVTNNQLIIEQGAEVRSRGLGVGYTANTSSSAIVRGSDSRLESTGLLFLIGALSPGTLQILDGGVIERTGDAVIAASTVGHATVDVAGAGSQFNVDGNLYLSGAHLGGQTYSFPDVMGELNITDNATVAVTGTLEPFNHGEVNLQSGRLTASEITLVSGGSFHFTGGRLSTQSFVGDLVQQGGTLAPGQSPGITQVSGLYQQDAGTLEIELLSGGTNPIAGVDFDQLTADSIILAGDLQIVLDSGYQPVLGDEFLIASATTSLTGEFDNVLSPQLAGDLAWDVLIDPLAKQVVLSVVTAGTAGDFDGDGDVDGRDFLVWQRDPSVGNLSQWQANYGASALKTNVGAVPEPATAGLLFSALVVLINSKRGSLPGNASPTTGIGRGPL